MKKSIIMIDQSFILDSLFQKILPEDLCAELLERRCNKTVEADDFLLKIAPFVDLFFESDNALQLDELIEFRRNYLGRHILHNKSALDLQGVDVSGFCGLDWRDLKGEKLEYYCIWAIHTEQGRHFSKDDKIFCLPRKIDHENPIEAPYELAPLQGFDVRDKGLSFEGAMIQAHYCLICHKREKDTCKKGCPLGQKISQMISTYRDGHVLGALAIAMVDNPMILATGHRICYDCALGCIFKTQTPVDVPGIESQIVRSVLESGKEDIFTKLSFWNPLKNDPFPSGFNGYQVLVVGSGPSGFTLALELLRRGYKVVMIEALQTFGGVMDYGITPRWDKSLLTKIKVILEAHPYFSFHAGVRFGEMFSLDDALQAGFDHVALCIGAAKPKFIGIESLPFKGIKMSNDFLMSLQQGKPYIENSATQLDIKFPLVVIGAGLSGVDAAVEAMMFGKNRDVSILYRGDIKDSPAARQNINEIQEAVDYGVKILDQREILEIRGEEGVEEIIVHNKALDVTQSIPAKTILIAAGTMGVDQIKHPRISYFGDADPAFRGSVVKAMASVKQGVKGLDSLIKSRDILHKKEDVNFDSVVEDFNVISENMIAIKIKSPLIASKAKLGQYVKFEILKADQEYPLEPIPLRIGRVFEEEGCFYVYVTNRGITSSALFNVGREQKVAVIGPFGEPLEIPSEKKCYAPVSKYPDDFLSVLNEQLQKNDNVISCEKDEVFDWAFDETGKINAAQSYHTTKSSFMCMMQGLCGQCLIKTHHDGESRVIFGCTKGICTKDLKNA